jgi:hypothetical protein
MCHAKQTQHNHARPCLNVETRAGMVTACRNLDTPHPPTHTPVGSPCSLPPVGPVGRHSPSACSSSSSSAA